MSARACGSSMERQASSENPVTDFSMNRLRTGTLPSSPAGPPPLGPGAPDRDRLLAFLDAIVGAVSRNKSLMAELAHTAGPPPQPAGADVAQDHGKHPVYEFWHGHISALIAAQRPDADSDLIAHLMLGALHSEPILGELASSGPGRLAAALRGLAAAVLDAPAAADAPATAAPG